MPANPKLIEITTRHQVLLEQLKSGKVRNYEKFLSDADAAVREVMEALKAKKMDTLTRTELNELLSELKDVQSHHIDLASQDLIDSVPDIAAYEADFEARALRSTMAKEDRKRLKIPTAEKTRKAAMTNPIQATGHVLKDFLDGFTASALDRTNKAVVNGYAQGATVDTVLKQLFGEGGGTGMGEMTRREAKTVVRTAVQHVASTARHTMYEENEDLITGYEWLSTLDGKTSTQCRSLDGKKFKLGKGPVPPIHPNCRSATVPVLDPAFDFLDEGATRSSQEGYVDAELTYYDWLKTQSPDFQDHVLGPVRGQLLRDGGLTTQRFAELQLNKNFEPITLKQMRDLEPMAFEKAGLEPSELKFADDAPSKPHLAPPELRWLDAWVAGLDTPAQAAEFAKLDAKLEPYRLKEKTTLYRFENTNARRDFLFHSWAKDKSAVAAMALGDGRIYRAEVGTDASLVDYDEVPNYEGIPGEVIVRNTSRLKRVDITYEILSDPNYIEEFNLDQNPEYAKRLAEAKLRYGKVEDRTHEPTPLPKPAATVSRPKSGTATGTVWDTGDALTAKLGRLPTRQEMLAALPDINSSTVGVQYGKWKGSLVATPTPVPTVAVKPIPVPPPAPVHTPAPKPVAVQPPPPEPLPPTPKVKPKEEKWNSLRSKLDAITETQRKKKDQRKAALNELSELSRKYPVGKFESALYGINTALLPTADRKRFNELIQLAEISFGDVQAEREKLNAEILAVLSAENKGSAKTRVRPLQPEKETSAFKNKRAKALEFLDALVSDRLKSVEADYVDGITAEQSGKGGYYEQRSKRVHVPESRGVSTHVHELTHHLELSLSTSDKRRVWEFVGARRGTEKLKSYKGHKNIQVFDDEWRSRGGTPYSGRLYPDGSGEILTTGVERLYNDALDFAERDPEHFEITVRTLQELYD